MPLKIYTNVQIAKLLWLALAGCTTPLVPKDWSNENEKNNKLFVFVGTPISFKKLPGGKDEMGDLFTAKYKVLQRVYGHYFPGEIEFTVYSHRVETEFQRYPHVMLFVRERDGKYYHETYQYFDVYKTKTNRWASSYKGYEYRHANKKTTTVKPEIIDFITAVAYPLEFPTDSLSYPNYPAPYYTFTGDSAYALYGNYVEDLFKLKKDGVLSARGLF